MNDERRLRESGWKPTDELLPLTPELAGRRVRVSPTIHQKTGAIIRGVGYDTARGWTFLAVGDEGRLARFRYTGGRQPTYTEDASGSLWGIVFDRDPGPARELPRLLLDRLPYWLDLIPEPVEPPAGREVREEWEGAACYFDGEREIAGSIFGVDLDAPNFWSLVEDAMIRDGHNAVTRPT